MRPIREHKREYIGGRLPSKLAAGHQHVVSEIDCLRSGGRSGCKRFFRVSEWRPQGCCSANKSVTCCGHSQHERKAYPCCSGIKTPCIAVTPCATDTHSARVMSVSLLCGAFFSAVAFPVFSMITHTHTLAAQAERRRRAASAAL